VAIVDRLESFSSPWHDATGAEHPPRFLDAVTVAGGPLAADRSRRAALAAERLERAREALATLALLAERGWDVRAAMPTARLAVTHATLGGAAENLLHASCRMYNQPTRVDGRVPSGERLDPIEPPRTLLPPDQPNASHASPAR
jgi:hypothetical protein